MILPEFHYSEQYQVSLPVDEKYRRNLLLRIRNPPKDKSVEEEDWFLGNDFIFVVDNLSILLILIISELIFMKRVYVLLM